MSLTRVHHFSGSVAGSTGSIGAEIMGRRKFTPQTGPWGRSR